MTDKIDYYMIYQHEWRKIPDDVGVEAYAQKLLQNDPYSQGVGYLKMQYVLDDDGTGIGCFCYLVHDFPGLIPQITSEKAKEIKALVKIN